MRTKAAPGRGHKSSEWGLWLYPKLLEAFECYKRIGVKFLYCLVLELASTLLLAYDSPYIVHSCDLKDNILLTQKLTHNWGQQFMHAHNILYLSQRSCPTYSPKKKLQIERSTSYYLGIFKKRFETGLFDENLMENIDETHFVVNMDNSRIIGF